MHCRDATSAGASCLAELGVAGWQGACQSAMETESGRFLSTQFMRWVGRCEGGIMVGCHGESSGTSSQVVMATQHRCYGR